jgi:hypothetical protein
VEDFILLSTSFLASMGGLALSIIFCIVLIKVMFREPKLSDEQLEALRDRPVTFVMPSHSTDVFGKQVEVRRRLEHEALEAHKDRPYSERTRR